MRPGLSLWLRAKISILTLLEFLQDRSRKNVVFRSRRLRRRTTTGFCSVNWYALTLGFVSGCVRFCYTVRHRSVAAGA